MGVGFATDIQLHGIASLHPEPIVRERNADQDIGSNTARDQEGNGQSEPQREGAEEDRQMQELQNIKEEGIDRKTAYGMPGPMPKKYVDDKNEVQESKEPAIQGPSLVACEQCVKYGRQCLAFNTTRRSVCSNCHQRRVRCSNSRKSMLKQAAMGEETGDYKPQPEAKPNLRRTVAPRRQVLSKRVEELEQVIEEMRAEVVKRERNDQLEDAILTMSNFIQQHTAALDTRLQIEQATAQRVRALEKTLLIAGIPIYPPVTVPDAGVTSRTNDASPMGSKSTPSLPRRYTDPLTDALSVPLHHVQGGRKRVASEVLSIPKRARSE